MRITQKSKEKTKKNILAIALKLFLKKGYEETTTRNIASEAGIAAGTMFNYFPGKEALAMTMVAEAMAKGRTDFIKRRSGEEGVAEDLFLLVSSELRRLRPFRSFVGPVLESTMSLFAKTKTCQAGEAARIEHMKVVKEIISSNGYMHFPDFISSSLYWSLYLGILAFWSNDKSPNQEETLAMIDYSLKVFTLTIPGAFDEEED